MIHCVPNARYNPPLRGTRTPPKAPFVWKKMLIQSELYKCLLNILSQYFINLLACTLPPGAIETSQDFEAKIVSLSIYGTRICRPILKVIQDVKVRISNLGYVVDSTEEMGYGESSRWRIDSSKADNIIRANLIKHISWEHSSCITSTSTGRIKIPKA